MTIRLSKDELRIYFEDTMFSGDLIRLASSIGLRFHGSSTSMYADMRCISRIALFKFLTYINDDFKNKDKHTNFFIEIKQLFDFIEAPRVALMRERLSYYDRLHDYQTDGILMSFHQRGLMLSFAPGLGKSITAQGIVDVHKIERTVILCTKSAKLNWKRELIKNGESPENITVVYGGGRKTERSREKYIILNYDLAHTRMKQLLSRNIDHLIIDESHNVKNVKTKRYKAVEEIKSRKRPRVTELTGTPIANRANDLYAQLKLLDHPLGRSLHDFEEKFCIVRKTPFGKMVIGSKNEDLLHRCLQNNMVRKTGEGIKMGVSYNEVYLPMESYLTEYKTELAKLLSKSKKSQAEIESAITSLCRITALSKLPAAIELIEDIAFQYEKKIVVFTTFVDVITSLEDKFKGSCVSLYGKTSDKMREINIKKFVEDDNIKIFIGQTIAAGESIDSLQNVCNEILMMDVPITPKTMEQATSRLDRIGQQHVVNCRLAIAEDTIDEQISKLLLGKKETASMVIDGKSGSFNFERIELQIYKELMQKEYGKDYDAVIEGEVLGQAS